MTLTIGSAPAVTRTGQDVCVVAGPPLGKTAARRNAFAWLVQERRVSARRILAITFTEKAPPNRRRLA
jgi:superfamily I DNA/RNA helicase